MARGPEQRRTIVELTSQSGERFKMTEELKPSGSFGRSFMVVFQDAAMALALDADAPPQGARVWAWAIGGGLSFEQYRTINQNQIGEAMGCSGVTIGRCMAYLREKGVVERIGAGPRQQWRLTPEAGWRGTTGQYHRRVRADAKGLSVIAGGREDA